MSATVTRRLRPYLFTGFRRAQSPRTISSTSLCASQNGAAQIKQKKPGKDGEKERDVTHDYEKRVAQLQSHIPLADCYPRLPTRFAQNTLTSVGGAREACSTLQSDETKSDDVPVTVAGMLHCSPEVEE